MGLPLYQIKALNKDTKKSTGVGAVWLSGPRDEYMNVRWLSHEKESKWDVPIFADLIEGFFYNLEIAAGTLTQVLRADTSHKKVIARVTPTKNGFRLVPISSDKPTRFYTLALPFDLFLNKPKTAEEWAALKADRGESAEASIEDVKDIQF